MQYQSHASKVSVVALSVTGLLVACSSSSSSPDDSAVGGAAASGGASSGTVVAPVTGGNTSVGGNLALGGSTSVSSNPTLGGSTALGSSSTSVSAIGGTSSAGGNTASGGRSSTATSASNVGGATAGASAKGGTTSAGGATFGGATATGGVGGKSSYGGTIGTGGATGFGGAGTAGSSGFNPCPATGACKVMPLGDSITEGTGYAGGYRVELFSKSLTDKKSLTFVGSLSNGPDRVSNVQFPKSHEGHFAWTIAQVDALVPDPALNVAPHIVLLHLGTNDMNQGLSGAPARLGSLIDQITTDSPNALVVVANIIPLPAKASAVTTYNAAITDLVRARIDAGKHVIGVDQFKGFPTTELGDGVHPNQAGYARMAGVWYEAIKNYLR